MTVRLTWDGKPTNIERLHLPFQTVETINESRATRERDQDALFRGSAPDHAARNLLLWGDNKLVMSSLLKDFAGSIDLIYIDPPFATGSDFTYDVKVGQTKIAKLPSALEETAYRDTWGHGMDSYLSMIYTRIVLMHDLLAPSGSFYIHMDSHMAHYVKILCDEIFGRDNFMREIIWRIGWISGYKAKAANWARNHDTIFFYVKDRANFTFNKIYIDHDPNYERRSYGSDEMDETVIIDDEGAAISDGKPIDDVWTNLPSIQIMSFSGEKTGYPTQKNLDLLERIIRSSSNEGDLVADFFCGAGTTLVAAERLGRRWIGSDLGRFAIHTTRKRLLSTPDCAPFDIKNLGAYERQHWQQATTSGAIHAYVNAILGFYKAEPLVGFIHLHGLKAGRAVHVGAVDAPITIDECDEVVGECAENSIGSCDILGWEWEMGLHDPVIERARDRGVDLRLRQIPREVIERDIQEKTEVRFFELAYVDLNVRLSHCEVSVALSDFAIKSDELIPKKVREQLAIWSDLIDYWSVDFDYRDDTFHNRWQAYRTKADPALLTETTWHKYDEPGTYSIVVKVIDIFGNDTTKIVEVVVK